MLQMIQYDGYEEPRPDESAEDHAPYRDHRPEDHFHLIRQRMGIPIGKVSGEGSNEEGED